MEQEGEKSFKAVTDRVISLDQPAIFETVPVILPMTEKLLYRNVVAGILIEVEEAVDKLIAKSIDAQLKQANTNLTALLEKLLSMPYTRLPNYSPL